MAKKESDARMIAITTTERAVGKRGAAQTLTLNWQWSLQKHGTPTRSYL